jgi:hypothetical protein
MNSGRTTYNYSIIPLSTINPFWLLGFIKQKAAGYMKSFFFNYADAQNIIGLPAKGGFSVKTNIETETVF